MASSAISKAEFHIRVHPGAEHRRIRPIYRELAAKVDICSPPQRAGLRAARDAAGAMPIVSSQSTSIRLKGYVASLSAPAAT